MKALPRIFPRSVYQPPPPPAVEPADRWLEYIREACQAFSAVVKARSSALKLRSLEFGYAVKVRDGRRGGDVLFDDH